jgi:HSF-type DNA-binding
MEWIEKKSQKRWVCAEAVFPGKLHDMLDYAQSNGMQHVISWTADGQAFMIHDAEELLIILPLFFSQTKYRSFQRQVSESIVV